jgi:hypothetical protein
VCHVVNVPRGGDGSHMEQSCSLAGVPVPLRVLRGEPSKTRNDSMVHHVHMERSRIKQDDEAWRGDVPCGGRARGASRARI